MEQPNEVSPLLQSQQSLQTNNQQTIEVIPQTLGPRKVFYEIGKTTSSFFVGIEDSLRTPLQVHMINLEHIPVLPALIGTSILSFLKASVIGALIYANKQAPDIDIIIKRKLEAFYDFCDWLDGFPNNFIIAYLFSIRLLGYFYPGIHPEPSLLLYALYYSVCLATPIMYSLLKGVFTNQHLNTAIKNKIRPSDRTVKVIKIIDYTVEKMLSTYVALGTLPLAIDITSDILTICHNTAGKAIKLVLYDYDFPISYIFLGVASVIAVNSCAYRGKPYYQNKIDKLIAHATTLFFIFNLISAITEAIEDKNYFPLIIYSTTVGLIPILTALVFAPTFQNAAYNTIAFVANNRNTLWNEQTSQLTRSDSDCIKITVINDSQPSPIAEESPTIIP